MNMNINPPQTFPTKLVDNHGRLINYLRLSVTDRCNLRCHYCRPEKGVPFIPHKEILSYEELVRLAGIFCSLGVTKIRVTGGEPFSRRDSLSLLRRLKELAGLEHLHITTNGVKTARYLDELADLGIGGINLSLDTLDRRRFWRITRRDYLESVLETLHGIIERQIPLKINSVVLEDTSDQEIVRLCELVRKYPLTLRFIERMPFSGSSRSKKLLSGKLSDRLKKIFPSIEECAQGSPSTARIFSVPGYQGKLGIIEGYSRLFCTACNKVRITPTGMLKTCLYDNGTLDVKKLFRQGADNQEISDAIVSCVGNRFVNGHEAERFSSRSTEPSMAQIGG
jgi:cyclic pyranopterin phosphate synthase